MPTGDLKHRMTQPAKKPISGLLWMVAGLGIGLFVALLVYLQGQPKSSVSFSEAINQEIEKAKQMAKKNQQEKATEKKGTANRELPKFDFYTILKEHEVFIPDSEIDNKTDHKPHENKAETKTGEADKSYLLQVGSFQNYSDADKRRATLALLGISSSIQEVQINNDTWHRVKVGPITDMKQLNKVRDQLIDNDIPSMIMVLK